MTEPFLGEIRLFGFNFAPRGWALCWGQTMSIAQNTALFSLLGTQYGGNGQVTFALPDLRSRLALGQGQGPGLSNYVIGEQTGTETVTLCPPRCPHTPTSARHQRSVVVVASRWQRPVLRWQLCRTSDGGAFVAASVAGGNQPFSVLQPVLVLNYCIALEGIFPSRN